MWPVGVGFNSWKTMLQNVENADTHCLFPHVLLELYKYTYVCVRRTLSAVFKTWFENGHSRKTYQDKIRVLIILHA